jgi:hypothetical protein
MGIFTQGTARRVEEAFATVAFCGSGRKIKRAGETPALRRPKHALADIHGAHRSPGWRGSGRSMLRPYGCGFRHAIGELQGLKPLVTNFGNVAPKGATHKDCDLQRLRSSRTVTDGEG